MKNVFEFKHLTSQIPWLLNTINRLLVSFSWRGFRGKVILVISKVHKGRARTPDESSNPPQNCHFPTVAQKVVDYNVNY